MKFRTVYLDRQILIDACNDDFEINRSINFLKSRGHKFPYSPAHVEEIVKMQVSEKRELIPSQINHLEIVSERLAFMPHETGPIELQFEDVVQCLRRVVAKNGRKLTEQARDKEKKKIEEIEKIYKEHAKFFRKKIKEIQKLPPDRVFVDPDILSALELMAITKGFRAYGDDFCSREKNIEILANTLNLFGFRKEHNKTRAENKLHDVSHCIYGSYSDIFVTNDDKLGDTSKAIFDFLKLETQVLNRKEFIAWSS